MEERERVKIVNYEGSKQIDRTKIDEQLRERGIELRLDSFLDEGVIRRVEDGAARDDGREGLHQRRGGAQGDAGGRRTEAGERHVQRQRRARRSRFARSTSSATRAISDGTLQRKLKENKPKGILSFITGGGTYKEAEFEADADRVVEYYQNQGYVRARVGQPELKVLENTKDGKTRWIQLRIPGDRRPALPRRRLSISTATRW